MESEDGGALGPLIGLRRPRYEILDAALSPWEGCAPGEGDAFVFVNLGSSLRHLFSEYAAANLTRQEMSSSPRALAAELFNLAGHYRNYLWRRHGRRSTVILYHSTQRCAERLAAHPDFKAEYYAKRLEPPSGALGALRSYADYNLRVAAALFRHAPNAHLVDTGPIDPEPWPMALMAEGRVTGPALVISSYLADLQYALAPETAVLLAKGPHTALVRREDLLPHALRESKAAPKILPLLEPEHFRYVLALAGDPDLGVAGLPKHGPAKAAQRVARRAELGALPASSPGILQLEEDGGLSEDERARAKVAWSLLDHATYAWNWATPERMALADAQILNRSSIGALEEADAKYFASRPLGLDMIMAGEDF